ncbi:MULTISPECIES: DUF6879 family protein [unclassified Streptomyces]|uniref:DUF6879 family protein n=1 Tax=unclassified Streptomyces TaxID=2593676 RepID=UPI002948B908|nr:MULTISPECIES: DUF6879 family protein [unclassified Streptomyces]
MTLKRPDGPEFLRWRQGHRPDPGDRESWWGGWHDAVRDAVARGVVVRRARIVSEPLSDYTRYESDWLPRRRATDLDLPGMDF